MQQLIEALSRTPLLAGIDHSDLRIDQLGGLLNANYKLTSPEMCIVVRLAGAGTEAFLNHGFEARNARAAAESGVAPEVLYSDDRQGIIVTRFVEGAEPLDAARAGSAHYLARIGRKLRELHTSSKPFANTFNPFHQLDRYIAITEAHGQSPQADFLEAMTRLDAVREVIDARTWASAPCHCDPLPGNILDDGDRLFLIDYEFSGNCDPLWDLGDFSGEAVLDETQDRDLLLSYFCGAVPPDARSLLVAYKAVSLLVAAGWAQVQVASGNGYEDFEAYGEVRLARCWDILESNDLQRLIGDLTTRTSDQPSRAPGAPPEIREHRRDESETRI
jgi:thiamine kinase-like enzyme